MGKCDTAKARKRFRFNFFFIIYNCKIFIHFILNLLNINKRQQFKRAFGKTMRTERGCIVNQLRSLGYRHIRNCSVGSWKCYGEHKFRITLTARLNRNKYLFKVSNGYEEDIKNSIAFHNYFNDKFDFIPYGIEIKLKGYICLRTDYIDSMSFCLKHLINRKNIEFFLSQANYILDQLNEYKIVHGDFKGANILVSRFGKMFLIDFDNCYSDKIGLCNYETLYHGFYITNENKIIYDDAYGFYLVFKQLGINNIETFDGFLLIKSKIGRNTYTINQ